jgi:phosphohistidine phosphatase
MKKLYLVRHAKSDRNIPGMPDFERPLNSRGRMDAPIMGDLLKGMKAIPDMIISSPATRALATARIIAEHMGYPLKKIIIEEEIYEAWRENLVDVIMRAPDTADAVMLIGHNPGLQLLADFLTDFNYENIPTCGVAGIELNIENWKDISQKCGRLLFFEYPKKLKS